MLDDKGQPPKSISDPATFYNCISINDIFQGTIGDCFLITTIVGVIKNRDLLQHLIPMDNAEERNKTIGAYHFRMWSMGDWYDVVVDDMVPSHISYKFLQFCCNMTFPNEIWVPLLEKAIVKYKIVLLFFCRLNKIKIRSFLRFAAGRYDILDVGGYIDGIAHIFSGGIYDNYSRADDSKSKSNQPDDLELFVIFEQAFKHNHLISCSHSAKEAWNGIDNEHEYSITDVKTINNTRILQIHNPHNVANHTLIK